MSPQQSPYLHLMFLTIFLFNHPPLLSRITHYQHPVQSPKHHTVNKLANIKIQGNTGEATHEPSVQASSGNKSQKGIQSKAITVQNRSRQ